MKQVRSTKRIHLPLRIQSADTFGKRLRGLMFRKEPLSGEGLWIVPCNSIHMFFVSFPIDVVFLDQAQRVVRAISDVQPRKIISPVTGAFSTLELPVGAITEYGIEIGDEVVWS